MIFLLPDGLELFEWEYFSKCNAKRPTEASFGRYQIVKNIAMGKFSI
jgi:hypothetical protein